MKRLSHCIHIVKNGMRGLFFYCLFISACSANEQDLSVSAVTPAQQQLRVLPSYDSMKIIISNYRKLLFTEAVSHNYALIEQKFVSVIVDSIFPYWYGTEWDFNGTTQTPQKGTIACGYFVSTVLRDAGIELNRVKTGQSASQLIVMAFADKKHIKTFSNKALDSTLGFVKKEEAGLFIIGLDNHVGFIHNDGQQIWFIHAKWTNPKAVVREAAAQSGILYYSKYRIIGKISSNKVLLDKWINTNTLQKN